MTKLKQINKKSFALHFKQLILFAICALFFGIGVHAQSSVENSATYKVTLPQKIEGAQKLEYIIDGKNMGSTSGVTNAEFAPQTVLNFLVQVEPESYSQLRAKDIKIKSQSGETLNLMKYMYDRNGKFVKALIPEDELINTKQTYVTSDYVVNYSDTLSLNELKKDSFNTNISIDTNDYSINQALDISYKIGTNSEPLSPIYNEKENRLEINNITANTPVTLTINKKQGFSQSKIEVFNGDNQINLFEDGSTTIPAVKSDVNIIIKNVDKNKYHLSFKNSDEISFEYRKHSEDASFKAIDNETLDVLHGENYDLRCNLTNENALENKEITANGVAIKKADNMYIISNIQEDTTIEITQKEESSYSIKLPDKQLGATITNESDEEITSAKAKFGESFKFKLKANEGYTQRIGNAMVYAVPTDKLEDNDYDTEKNPEEASEYLLTPSSNDVLTIPEVKEPTSIIIKNLVKNTYKVTFPKAPTGVSYKVETSENVKETSQDVYTVVHGSKVFVTLDVAEGKHIGKNSLSTSNSDTTITNKENKYTIENIKGDTNIVIGNVEDKKCSITPDSQEIIVKDEKGFAVGENTLTVNYNGSTKFKVGLARGYDSTKEIEPYIVSGNATLTKLDEPGVYEISNVTNDVKISAKGVEKDKITIRFGSDSGENLNFKGANNKILSPETQVDFGSDLEFEVSSSNGSNQMYTITSSNRNARIEALNNSTNKFILRKATSDTDLFAVSIYTSYGGPTEDLKEVEDNGKQNTETTNINTAYALESTNESEYEYKTSHILEEPNQDNITENTNSAGTERLQKKAADALRKTNLITSQYNTSYTLEEPNIGINENDFEDTLTNANADGQKTIQDNSTRSQLDENNSTSLTSGEESFAFFVNGVPRTRSYINQNYDIYYALDYTDENLEWHSLSENPDLKLYDNEVSGIDASTFDGIAAPKLMDYHYKMKLKVKPKNNRRSVVTNLKLTSNQTSGQSIDLMGDSNGVTVQAAGHRHFKVDNINIHGDALTVTPTNGQGYTEQLNDENATVAHMDLAIRCPISSKYMECDFEIKKTTLYSSCSLFIYEKNYISIQPLNRIHFSTPTTNAANISQVKFEYTDYNDRNNDLNITQTPVNKPDQDWNLLSGPEAPKPKMTLVNGFGSNFVGSNLYESNFDMKISVEAKNNSVGLDFIKRIVDGNEEYAIDKYILKEKNYHTTGLNRYSKKYIAILDQDGNPDYSDDAEFLFTDQTYLDVCEVSQSSSGDINTVTLHMKGKFSGNLSNTRPPSDYISGASDCYVDRYELNYDCVAPRFVPTKIKFNNPSGRIAEFLQNNNNSPFPEIQEEESDQFYNADVGAGGSLVFKLKTAESRYIAFSEENAKNELEQALIIEKTPSASKYELEALDWSDDHSEVKYVIRNIINETQSGPIKLNISFNTNLIQIRQFTGNFKGTSSTYQVDGGIPVVSKTFAYDNDFTCHCIPDNTADSQKIKHIKITIDTIDYDYPLDAMGQSRVMGDNKIEICVAPDSNKLKIDLSHIHTDFDIYVDYGLKDLDITFYADNTFHYKCLSPNAWANDENNGIVPANESQSIEKKQITYGSSFSFVVVASEGHSIDNIEVTANGMPIELTSGKYSLYDITSPQEIRVRGVTASQNNVTFTQYDDIFFKTLNNELCSEQTPVEYDQSISFKITTSSAYSGSTDDIRVFAAYTSGNHQEFIHALGRNEIKNSDGSYKLEHIKEAVRIYVEGMTPNKYDITLNPTKGIEYYNEYGTRPLETETVDGKTVYKQKNVTHGENFSFKVVAKTGYDISNLKIYDKPDSSSNSEQLLSSHDVYTISNVTENHTVTAQNTPKSKCKIEFRTLTGANFTDSSGNTIEKSIEVDYGSDYKFKISLEGAYSKSQPVVNIKGVAKPLQKASNGSYTIPNITEDKIIELSNVSKNTYTATFVDTEGVIYRTAKNKPFTGTQPIEYEGTLNFKISLMDAYDKSTPMVLLDDKKILSENSGVYSISNVHDDVVITVKNVVKNPEEISISENLKVPQEINTEGDVDAVVKATQVYMGLSDEDKEQVTNIDDLKRAQEHAGRINHSAGDTEIAGVDWNIKLIVTRLTDDEEQMKDFRQKVDGRSIFSLYEIHLVDLLTGKAFEVPYGQKVSVIVPAPNFDGYKNPVVAHETSGGSMEYLDLSVVDNRAQFETASFSKFGIVAKKLENYVENPSNLKISVGNLVENEDELRSLLGEGLVSQLGNLLDNDDKEPDKQEVGSPVDNSTQNEDSLMDVLGLKKVFDEAGMEDSYNWILEHELIIVSSILLVGALLIWLLLAMARKKKKEEEEEKSKNKK